MSDIRIESVEEPFRTDEVLARDALRLVFRAEYLGCLRDVGAVALGPELVRSIGRCLDSARLPSAHRYFVTSEEADLSPKHWRAAIEAMNDQIEMSPLPAGEWPPVVTALDEDLVAAILGISTSSVRRYHAGSRPTPQDVAERLHFLALLLADLAGSYNDYGMRRWFTRPRAVLGNRRPLELLGAGFDPDGPDAHALKELAASLSAAGAA